MTTDQQEELDVLHTMRGQQRGQRRGLCAVRQEFTGSLSVPGQPPAAGQMPSIFMPNYLVFAILATVLCCLPAGIPAIVYAAQVNGKLQAGDIAGAQDASKNAKMWCWISLGAGLAVGVVWGILAAIGALSSMHR
ncbi:MAG: CD225/dispanin family protein [Candidatus Sulfotelmatobacter sp.]